MGYKIKRYSPRLGNDLDYDEYYIEAVKQHPSVRAVRKNKGYLIKRFSMMDPEEKLFGTKNMPRGTGRNRTSYQKSKSDVRLTGLRSGVKSTGSSNNSGRSSRRSGGKKNKKSGVSPEVQPGVQTEDQLLDQIAEKANKQAVAGAYQLKAQGVDVNTPEKKPGILSNISQKVKGTVGGLFNWGSKPTTPVATSSPAPQSSSVMGSVRSGLSRIGSRIKSIFSGGNKPVRTTQTTPQSSSAAKPVVDPNQAKKPNVEVNPATEKPSVVPEQPAAAQSNPNQNNNTNNDNNQNPNTQGNTPPGATETQQSQGNNNSSEGSGWSTSDKIGMGLMGTAVAAPLLAPMFMGGNNKKDDGK